MELVWRDVKGYEGLYQISNLGNVKSLDRKVPTQGSFSFRKGRDLTTRINNYGYVSVRLSKNGKCKTTFIHRLIAEAFIPNPENKLFINHKNGIKSDNEITNLEWVSHSENIKHAYAHGLLSPTNTRKVINELTLEIYASIRIAAASLRMNYNTCKNMLAGYNPNTIHMRYV